MSDNDHYTTPIETLRPIRAYLGGVIELDPCSNIASVVNARTEWFEEDNGLRDWGGHRNSYTNPPYSPGNLPTWTEHVYNQYRRHEMTNLMLIPVSTATQWWHRFIVQATWLLFYEGRISFGTTLVPSDGKQNRHDSVLVAFDPNPKEKLIHELFGKEGWLVKHF